MTKLLKIGLVTLVAASLAAAALAQGRGNGRMAGRGRGVGYGRGAWAAGVGGQGAGWQARVDQAGDPALTAKVADLHQQIRDKQWALRAAQAAGQDTSALEAAIKGLRDELQATMRQAGLCVSAGPNAFGMTGAFGAGFCAGLGPGYGAGSVGDYGWQRRLWSVDDPALVQRITDLHQQVRNATLALQAARLNGEDTAELQTRIYSLRAELQAANLQAGIGLGLGPCNGGAPGAGRGVGGSGWGGRGAGRGNCPYQWQQPAGN